MIKHAFCNILHYSVLIVVNLSSVICLIFYFSGEDLKEKIYYDDKLWVHGFSIEYFILFSCVYILTFTFNVITITIVMIVDKPSYCCFNLESFKNIIVEVTHDVSGFINPINLLHRKKDGNVTNKKILQIRRNSAITLFCFSIGMIIVFVITFSISTKYLVRDFYEKIELPGRTFFSCFPLHHLRCLEL